MTMKKRCELCKNKATIYCDSDQAILCWTCDANVHSANFLVARHSRCLLCHVCQSPTSWTATGSKLGPCLSVCLDCIHQEEEDEDSNEEEEEDDDVEEEEEEAEAEAEEEEEGEEENQVVPWSTPPPPSASSSSSSEESTDGQPEVSRKRARENALDDWCNENSENVSRKNVRTPLTSTEGTAEMAGAGFRSGVAEDDSSSTSTMIRRRIRPLKARRTETGRAEGDSSA